MSRTSPFFVPQKEIDLIDSMNEELIDEIIGQSVDIYKVSIDNTDENVYGESTTKYYEVGFRVNCLIQFNEPEITQDEFGADENSDIEILAVGIGHDVTRYYNKAIKIADVQELGDVMINQLTKLFSEKGKKTIH